MKPRRGRKSRKRVHAPPRKIGRAIRKREQEKDARGVKKTIERLLTRPREAAGLKYWQTIRTIAKVEKTSIAQARRFYRDGLRAPGGLKGVRYRAIFQLPQQWAGMRMTRRYYLKWTGKPGKRRQVVVDRASGKFVSGKTYRRQRAAALREARYRVIAEMLGTDRAGAIAVVKQIYGGSMRDAILDVAYKVLVVSAPATKRERAADRKAGRPVRRRHLK